MKPLIVGLALTILFTSFSIYQLDNNRHIRESEILKYVADECSASGSLYFDKAEFSIGKKVFNDIESLKAIEFIIKKSLHLDDSFNPLPNTYWTETIVFDVYYFDDSLTMRKYTNGVLVEQNSFNYPYLFVDSKTSYTKAISEPTVIVTIDAGKPRYRLLFLTPTNVIRSSAYEYQGR